MHTNGFDGGGILTTDGRFWPCGSGKHQFTAASIIEREGAEYAEGAIVIWPSGIWMVDGERPITKAQYATADLLAEFPECAIKTAAEGIMRTMPRNWRREIRRLQNLVIAS